MKTSAKHFCLAVGP